jgi:hypothetical protein
MKPCCSSIGSEWFNSQLRVHFKRCKVYNSKHANLNGTITQTQLQFPFWIDITLFAVWFTQIGHNWWYDHAPCLWSVVVLNTDKVTYTSGLFRLVNFTYQIVFHWYNSWITETNVIHYLAKSRRFLSRRKIAARTWNNSDLCHMYFASKDVKRHGMA